jgi:hypothetical protein
MTDPKVGKVGRAGRRLAVWIGAGLLVAAGSARASDPPGATTACPERWEAAAGPLPGGAQPKQPADFGAIPEACPASDVSLRLRGALLDDSGGPGFFGDVLTDLAVRARRRIGAHGWLSLAVDLFNFRYVDNGGLASTGPSSFGPPTVGYYQGLADSPRAAVAVYARALLPLDTARQTGTESGLELGGSGRARMSRRWVLDGGLSVAGPLDVVAGQAHARLEPAALAEGWFSPRPALAVFAGGSRRVEVAPTPTWVTVVPRAGLRAALRKSLWFAVLAEAPVAGADRTNLIVSLFLGWSP